MQESLTTLQLAQRLGSHPAEILVGLVLAVALLVFLAPRLVGLLFRRLRPVLRRAGASALAGRYGQRFRRRWPQLFQDSNQARDARGFLALYLLLGLASLVGWIWLFAEIAQSLVAEPAMQAFDTALAQSLRSHASGGEVLFFSSITHLAGVQANLLLGLVVAISLLVKGEKALLQVWLFGLIGSGLLISGLKGIFQRPRPVLANPFAIETSYSFPSGHSVSSLVTYGLLAYVLVLSTPRITRRLLVFTTISIGVSVGLSRMVLGVHYFSDVMAGWSVGLAWLSLVLGGAEYSRRRALLKAGMSDLSAETPPESS